MQRGPGTPHNWFNSSLTALRRLFLNSPLEPSGRCPRPRVRDRRNRLQWFLSGAPALSVLFTLTAPLAAAPPSPDTNSAAAQSAFAAAQSRFSQHSQDPTLAWQFARACFDLAEFATNRAGRASLADQGIAASRQAIARDSNSAPAHYYLGMNLGQLARTRTLSALKLVNEMEHEFSRAAELDAHFDNAGPDRNLGLLYRDAPTIGSIGSRAKARQHFQRAIQVAPQFPANRLDFIEALVRWNDRPGAQAELKALEDVLPAARAAFTGAAWASSWADWEPRLQRYRRRLEDPSHTLESPRTRQQ